MKKIVLFLVFLIFLLIFGLFVKRKLYHSRQLGQATEKIAELTTKNELQDGDIIFQTSLSKQSKAIQLATHSKYSHCGLIWKTNKGYFVFEAVQPVKLTPVAQWIAKGKDGHFVVKRLKDAAHILTPATLAKMTAVGNTFNGKNYDVYFDWSDDKIYCSELVWKIYKRATGLEIGKIQKLRDFDLSNDAVKQLMKKRYGDHIPFDETVISPASIFNSDLLVTVAAQ